MNELTCTICFDNRPRFIRQCKCFYCENCREKALEVCQCGSTGGFTDLTQTIPDEVKHLSLDNAQLLKRISEYTQERIQSIILSTFAHLQSVFDLKNHQQKQLNTFLQNKVKSAQRENEELKKRAKPQIEAKENLLSFSQLEDFKFSTPRGLRPVVPLSNSKKPFEHEGFSSFFSKNK